MPKLSLSKKDAVELGFGFGEGWGRVVEVKSVAHQFQASKKTGEQTGPACFLFIVLDRCDESGKSVGDEPTTDELKLGDLQYFRPGKIDPKNPDGDPEDLGDDLGTEGNSIYSTGERKLLKKRGMTKGGRFLFSLEEAGFKADILGRGYLPDLAGALAHFTQETQEGGTDKEGKKIEPWQCLIVDKIVEFPYDGKGAGAVAGMAKGPAAVKGKNAVGPSKGQTTAPAKDPETVAAPNGSAGDSDDIARAFLGSMLEGWAGKTHNVAKLAARSFTYCGKMTPPAKPAVQAAVSKLLSNAAWVAEAGGPMGITVAGDEATFPAED